MACATTLNSSVRTWVDAKTAVAVTAQARPIVLSREDFPAGVNVRDYAELGVVDANRSGNRKHYLAVVLWSTVDRKPTERAQLQAAFADTTLWATQLSAPPAAAAVRPLASVAPTRPAY